MIVFAFLVATQPVPVTLLDKADAASAAYVQCLYTVSRNANAARLSDGEFEQKLAGSCLAEERASRELATNVFALRGDSEPARKAGLMMRETRLSMIAQYRKLPDLEHSLERLAEICRAQPEACRE